MSSSARTDADSVSSSLKLKRRSAPRRYLMRDSLAEIARAFRGAATAGSRPKTLDKENRQFLAKLAGRWYCFSESRKADSRFPMAARDQGLGIEDSSE
jgi:hypothetical protein